MKITTISRYVTSCLLLVGWNTYVNSASLPPTTGKVAMVVTSQQFASRVGIEILKQGGNAIDAAVGIGYALAVTEPCCGNIGGGGFMLIHFANGKNTLINFREKAPQASNVSFFLDKNNKPIAGVMDKGYLPVAVPGTVYGLNYALAKYGTWPLKKIMAPAIDLARNGFILQEGDIPYLKSHSKEFQSEANVAAIFLNKGSPYQAGDKLVQKNLANTLDAISAQGTKAFYQGTIADQIVQASKKNGGLITHQDLSNYNIEELPPIICDYRGYQVISAPPPSAGGVALCEMLQITEAYPLRFLGYHSAAAVHYITEAMRYAYAERNTYLGDPNFVKNPVTWLLSPQHIANLRAQITEFQAGDSNHIGLSLQSNPEKNNTTHYSVVDKYGNAVAVTYTINSIFGAGVIAGESGFFLNNEMGDFSLPSGTPDRYKLVESNINSIQSGKRPLSSMTPTIILKDNQLFMVLGAPGGPTITTQVLETMENVLDYNMNIQEAVDAPRFHMQWFPDIVYLEPYIFSVDTLKELQCMGYHFQTGSPFGTETWGAVEAILRDPTTGLLYGASDPRRPSGLALGY